MISVKQLKLFQDVVQQGSFTKAAALHQLDNSSLSKQIKKLEASLGVQLLNRSTRSFSLTSVGQSIFEQTQALSETLNQIENIALSHQSQPEGVLRITSPHFFAQMHLQPVITKFMRQYPQVKVVVSLDDNKQDLITERFDLALRITKLQNSNLIAKKIAKTQFAIVASQNFVMRNGYPKSPDELIALPAIVYSNANVVLDQIRLSENAKTEVMNNYQMRGNLHVSDVRAMLSAVQDGLGYCLIDLSNLDAPLLQLGLVPLLTDHKLSNFDTGLYAVYAHRNQTPLVSKFLDMLVSHVGEPAFWQAYIPGYGAMYRQNE